MAKYIVDLPDSFNENDRRTLAYNGVLMHPIPYEESVGIYKGVLEFLKIADKYSLEKIYGVNSLEELFNSLSVSDIIGKYKTELSKYKRVSELANDIGLFELRSIVNNLYDAKCDERRRLVEIMKTLKGKNKSESDPSQ